MGQFSPKRQMGNGEVDWDIVDREMFASYSFNNDSNSQYNYSSKVNDVTLVSFFLKTDDKNNEIGDVLY